MTNGISNKLMPFCLKFFAATTITEREHQAIKLADHTHQPPEWRALQYNGDYYLQIDRHLVVDRHLVDNPLSEIEIVFYNESIFKCEVYMTSATLINRFPYPIEPR